MSEANPTVWELETRIRSYQTTALVPKALKEAWKKAKKEEELPSQPQIRSISMAEKEAIEKETEKKKRQYYREKNKGQKSLRGWYMAHKRKDRYPPSAWQTAIVGDILLRTVREQTIRETAGRLQHQARWRKDITDYAARKAVKVRCGKHKLYLIQSESRALSSLSVADSPSSFKVSQ